MKVWIEKLNGDIIDLEDIGVFCRDFVPESPDYEHEFATLPGRSGNIDNGSRYASRRVKASFYLKAMSIDSYAMSRDRVYRTLDSKEAYYIVESRTPWKRRKVKLASPFEMEQTRIYGFFEVEWETVGIPFAESRLTSRQPKEWQDSGWYWGSGIRWGEGMNLFDTSSFTVHNAGDVDVVGTEAMLNIEFTGPSSNLTITNLTTGQSWAYNATTLAGDVITLTGVRKLKNGASIVLDSGRTVFKLAPGDNQFQVTGATGAFTISFEFRYLYI